MCVCVYVCMCVCVYVCVCVCVFVCVCVCVCVCICVSVFEFAIVFAFVSAEWRKDDQRRKHRTHNKFGQLRKSDKNEKNTARNVEKRKRGSMEEGNE